MPLNKVNTKNPIRGLITPNASQRKDCQDVIAKFDFAGLGKKAGTLHTSGSARIDMQGYTAKGQANLQVQIGSATVAAVLVESAAWSTTNAENQKGIQNAVISVLNQSLDSSTVWELQGKLP